MTDLPPGWRWSGDAAVSECRGALCRVEVDADGDIVTTERWLGETIHYIPVDVMRAVLARLTRPDGDQAAGQP